MRPHTIYEVVKLLESNRIYLTISRNRSDSIRIDATLLGLRAEIECFEDNHMEVSTFKGNEDIEGGYERLLEIVDAYTSD